MFIDGINRSFPFLSFICPANGAISVSQQPRTVDFNNNYSKKIRNIIKKVIYKPFNKFLNYQLHIYNEQLQFLCCF